jgi:hypothetical protein
MKNKELAYKVLDHVEAHPELLNMGTWVCGTQRCFAGFTVELLGYELRTDRDGNPEGVYRDGERVGNIIALGELAREGLGLDWRESDELFHLPNGVLRENVERIFGPRDE